MIDELQAHYGFARMPFGRDLAPACCTGAPPTTGPAPASPGGRRTRIGMITSEWHHQGFVRR